jgi:hypothetical protein
MPQHIPYHICMHISFHLRPAVPVLLSFFFLKNYFRCVLILLFTVAVSGVGRTDDPAPPLHAQSRRSSVACMCLLVKYRIVMVALSWIVVLVCTGPFFSFSCGVVSCACFCIERGRNKPPRIRIPYYDEKVRDE